MKMLNNENIGIVGTYKISASDYIKKHNPCLIGNNKLGSWYEHPLYGDESPVLLETPDNKIHKTIWWEMPDIDSTGNPY